MKNCIKKFIHSIKGKIFFSFSATFVLLLLLSFTVYYFIYSPRIKENMLNNQESLCAFISHSITLELETMNTVSMNIVYSNIVQNTFAKYVEAIKQAPAQSDDNVMSNAADTPDYFAKAYFNSERISSKRALLDLIIYSIGPLQTVSQVNIYDFSGNVVGTGLYETEEFVDIARTDWYDRTIKLQGARYISTPMPSQLSQAKQSHLRDEQYISLMRVYKSNINKANGIIEVAQSCNEIFGFLEEMNNDYPGSLLIIVNSEGELIYPYNHIDRESINFYMDNIGYSQMEYMKLYDMVGADHAPKIVMRGHIDYADWEILIISPRSEIYMPLTVFLCALVFSGLAAVVVAVIMSLYIARRISSPLSDLQNALTEFRVIQFKNLPLLELPINCRAYTEIAMVSMALENMYAKLREATNALLFARTEEMNAKMYALQSLMNPHFFYNTLSAFSLLAEDRRYEEIIKMCEDIAFMLRYVSVIQPDGVTVESEVNYLQKYCQCLNIRYGQDIEINYDIPQEMQHFIIPKLLIQPLVENSVKYGLSGSPPWRIIVSGESHSDNTWSISVRDYGVGFDPQVIRDIMQQIDLISPNVDISSLQIQGMGLVNIALRLKILYGDRYIFSIENLPAGGACVTVGGPCSSTDNS